MKWFSASQIKNKLTCVTQHQKNKMCTQILVHVHVDI